MKYTDANGTEYTAIECKKDSFGGTAHIAVSFWNPTTQQGGTGWVPAVLWIALVCPPVPRPSPSVWGEEPMADMDYRRSL